MVDVAGAVRILVIHHFRLVVVTEDAHEAAAIPIISHTTAVVDLACRVLQHLKDSKNGVNGKRR